MINDHLVKLLASTQQLSILYWGMKC